MSWVERLKEKLARKGVPPNRQNRQKGFWGFWQLLPPAPFACDNTRALGPPPPSFVALRVEHPEPKREISQTGVPPN